MASSDTNKDNIDLPEQVEDIKNDQKQYEQHLVMPASLAALDGEEYARLGRRAVLKMDLIIMPTLTIMYILNYLDRQNIASAKLADIDKDLNLSAVEYKTVSPVAVMIPSWEGEGAGFMRTTENIKRRPEIDIITVSQHPFRGLYPSAGAQQHDSWQNQVARHLHLRWHGNVGTDQCFDGCCPELRWPPGSPYLSWIRRGCLLPWRLLLPLPLLQSKADGLPNGDTVLWFSTGQRLWWALRYCGLES